jgi:cytosine/adenosine deaminase-related metal-dependent hydrolase
MARSNAVVFFDLVSMLSGLPPEVKLPSDVAALIGAQSEYRCGILSNLPSGQGHADMKRLVEALGLEHSVDPSLIVVGTEMRCPLPNPRAFQVAAALADQALAETVFVSANHRALVAAAAAGMRTVAVPTSGAQFNLSATTAMAAADGGTRERDVTMPELLAGEIDEDVGPTYILRGRVVTMNSAGDVWPGGAVVVSKGKIAAVLNKDQDIPAAFEVAPVIDTKGTIYPGLIDLHNHYVYNVLPLWVVPEKYDNRSQWPRHDEYRSGVSKPIRQALAKFSDSAEAIVRFVEARAIMSGTTTGQGMRTQVNGGARLFRGAMRNVEETNDHRLPEARTRVPDLTVTGASGPERIERFRRALNDTETRGAGYFYHLSEGVDDRSRRHFMNLFDHDLIGPSLIGIHSLGLKRPDLDTLAEKGAKIVWSPFSNMLLYGETLDLKEVREAGVGISLGCDWSPTGSKNLLQELKVAAYVNEKQGSPFSSQELVALVTSSAAAVTGWEHAVGSIRTGLFADVFVVSGQSGDPFDHLIGATENNVALVAVHGVPRFGDPHLVERLHTGPAAHLEPFRVGKTDKAFNLHNPSSPINHLRLGQAIEVLRDAMQDLPGFVDQQMGQEAELASMGVEVVQRFVLELDNEFEPDDDVLHDFDTMHLDPTLLADVPMVDQLPLESVFVDPKEGEYWKRVGKQKNIDPALINHLRTAYGMKTKGTQNAKRG